MRGHRAAVGVDASTVRRACPLLVRFRFPHVRAFPSSNAQRRAIARAVPWPWRHAGRSVRGQRPAGAARGLCLAVSGGRRRGPLSTTGGRARVRPGSGPGRCAWTRAERGGSSRSRERLRRARVRPALKCRVDPARAVQAIERGDSLVDRVPLFVRSAPLSRGLRPHQRQQLPLPCLALTTA